MSYDEIIFVFRNRPLRQASVPVVGVGNLTRSLLRYRGFQQQGFRTVALFDADPEKVGQEVDGLRVCAPERLAELGILAVPGDVALLVADALVAADLAVQLEQLAFLVQTSTNT